ncbi:inorganic phosphate transporter [Leekyejoonella antrihumi]|uniref:Phosphate transporter n=1 Tax=Leekyejoonella antrihumi TaxID=1660198 RepID=A0A563DZ84_9MICO|nr:inorganic phosphate transporter [Leekyejoonella antrihumi]TWP35273.1 inorganic phosphate transporter [Leekyejoonella antrihumi]
MSTTLFLVIVVVITALAFDFTNGFHDSANAMATSVATGALRPRVAVLIAAVLNIVGAFLSTEVAKTISGGIVEDSLITPWMVFAGLCGAILWNLATWLLGLPSSSSHALFGGLIGAVLVGAGMHGIHFSTIMSKVIIPAVVAPVVAGFAACAATFLIYRLVKKPEDGSNGRLFKHGQTVTSSLVALAHGTSDGQKTMGVITLVLISAGYQASGSGPQVWVIVIAGLAIGLGTYSGGWRIMRTMGKGVVDVTPPQGFAAETASTAAILASSHMGFALSTTHVCSGSIMGTGIGRRAAIVRWGTARRMAVAWIVTLPAAASVGAAAAFVAQQGTLGEMLVLAALVLASAWIWLMSRRNAISAANVNDSADVTLTPVATVTAQPAPVA